MKRDSISIRSTECLTKIRERVYQQMDGIKNINNEKPNAGESKQLYMG